MSKRRTHGAMTVGHDTRRKRKESQLGDKHTQALAKELGGKTPPALDGLGPAEIDTLTELLRRARHNQQAQLNHAFEAALGHIPLLLRAPIRKILSS